MSEETKTVEKESTIMADLNEGDKLSEIEGQHKRYLTLKEIIAFCIVKFGQKNIDEFVNSKLQYFLIQFFGLSEKRYANIKLGTTIYDALDDTISGLIIDRTRTRWGRVKPYLVLPLPLLVIGLLMLFSTPDLTQNGKTVWATVGMVVYGLGMSYFGAWYLILYNNTPNLKERNNLITTSEFASLFGTWIVSFLPVMLDIGKKVGITEGKVFSGFTVIILIITCVAAIYGFTCMRERVPLQTREEMKETGIIDSFKAVFTNGPMFCGVIGGLFNGIKSVGSGIETFFWFNCTGAYSYQTIAGLFTGLPNFIMTPLAGKMVNKWGGRTTRILAGVFGGVAYFAMWLIGYAPFGGTFQSHKILNMVWLTVALMICGLPNHVITVADASLQGDIFDYNEWRTGMRNEALVNTVNGYFGKLGISINGWLSGMVLHWINYQPLTDAAGNAIAQQDPAILKGLWAVFALTPAIARFLGGCAFIFFKVHGKFKEQMLIDIAERRKEHLAELDENEVENED